MALVTFSIGLLPSVGEAKKSGMLNLTVVAIIGVAGIKFAFLDKSRAALFVRAIMP